MPTVETPSGAFERPIALTSSTIRAAPSSASLRRGIGVEPAWLSKPVKRISYQRWPWPCVTTPTSINSSSRIGPCSMWSSKKACTGRAPTGSSPLKPMRSSSSPSVLPSLSSRE